jgi:hypothetical protein
VSYAKVCAQCDRDFVSRRPDAETCSEECEYQRWIETGVEAPQPVTHPLQLVREEQERDKEKARWTLLAREHLSRTLLVTGFAHADDFDSLSIRDDHRNVIGSQMGSFVQRGLMVEIGRRASSNPSRKSAKSAIYEVTRKGRDTLTLAGLSGGSGGTASAESGEKEEIVGPTTAAEGMVAHPRDGRSGRPGELTPASVTREAPSAAHPPPAVEAAADAGSPAHVIPGQDLAPCQESTANRSDKPAELTTSQVAPGSDPEVLQLDLPRESESTAYSTVVDEAA